MCRRAWLIVHEDTQKSSLVLVGVSSSGFTRSKHENQGRNYADGVKMTGSERGKGMREKDHGTKGTRARRGRGGGPLLLLLLLQASVLNLSSSFRIVAAVNSEVITWSELQHAVGFNAAFAGGARAGESSSGWNARRAHQPPAPYPVSAAAQVRRCHGAGYQRRG